MPSERFEMRIDSEILERLDNWRNNEEDCPSRAEAVRRLLESGLAHDNKGRSPHLSDGEKLITAILCDFAKAIDVKLEINIDIIQKIMTGGHYWALGLEMPILFYGHADKQKKVRFVFDVLDMWTLIEDSFDALSLDEKEYLSDRAKKFWRNVSFRGFDGNHEGEYLGITSFIVDDLNRFSRFRDKQRDLNSHIPTLQKYGKMLQAFEPIRKTLSGRHMNLAELTTILNAGI